MYNKALHKAARLCSWYDIY